MQAQKVRQKITDDYVEAFRQCDAVVTPTIPQFPPKLGEFLKNPMEMYLSDVYTVGVNMAGLPGISLPVDKVGSLFTSIQLIGRPFGESELFQIARAVEHCAA
jgi:aspartyl-tRNA(Asn)/glutamyl-tRNA(Gln) amidotransferase subunit A